MNWNDRIAFVISTWDQKQGGKVSLQQHSPHPLPNADVPKSTHSQAAMACLKRNEFTRHSEGSSQAWLLWEKHVAVLIKMHTVITLTPAYLQEWWIQKHHHPSDYENWPHQGRPGISILCPCQETRQGPQKQVVPPTRTPDSPSGHLALRLFLTWKLQRLAEKITQGGLDQYTAALLCC